MSGMLCWPTATVNRGVERPVRDPAGSTEAADLYIGYFEGRHGEQWIFRLTRHGGAVSLYGIVRARSAI